MPRPRALLRREREAALRDDFGAADRLAGAAEAFVLGAAGFFALERFAAGRFAVEPLAAGRLDGALFAARLLLVEEGAPGLSSDVHLPDITRWAASATASAIKEPSLVALAITLVAACVAVSAASRPASRIARRALGLALIAAAAAASPAASISLLIAALAILSTVSLAEVEPEELFRVGLAMTLSPSVSGKDNSGK